MNGLTEKVKLTILYIGRCLWDN